MDTSQGRYAGLVAAAQRIENLTYVLALNPEHTPARQTLEAVVGSIADDDTVDGIVRDCARTIRSLLAAQPGACPVDALGAAATALGQRVTTLCQGGPPEERPADNR